jgi:hypothetical protein
MIVRGPQFLPGVPEDLVRAALALAGGNEIESGKLDSLESSAALAVNAFGWFLERPNDLPAFPSLSDLEWPALRVDLERQMRFPWRGGRHPWLDAAVETPKHLLGIESKRYEPFRDAKKVAFSAVYDGDVWGDNKVPYIRMRDALRAGDTSFIHLDAAQLVKHAFGLVTEGGRVGKSPLLLYLYAEPAACRGTSIGADALARHRDEIDAFAAAVAGSAVRFASCSYREWLTHWTGSARPHADALIAHFQP